MGPLLATSHVTAKTATQAAIVEAYPYAWRYQDWVIESVNKDHHDQFIKQQLAADLMPGTSRNDLRALGYLSMAPSEWKRSCRKELIDNLLLEEWDERVDAVGRGNARLIRSPARAVTITNSIDCTRRLLRFGRCVRLRFARDSPAPRH
ncbi:MAG: DUF1549 domain-containing protein [Blastocatellia bacterium]